MSNTNNTDDETNCTEMPCQSTRTRATSTSESSENSNMHLRGRPVLYTGVLWIGVLRRFLIPRTCGISSPASESQPGPKEHQRPVEAKSVTNEVAGTPSSTITATAPFKILRGQPATLLVSETVPEEEDDEVKRSRKSKSSERHSPLAALMSRIQYTSTTVTGSVRRFSKDVKDLVQEGHDATTVTIKSIRRHDSSAYRYIAIGSGGMVGYLMGLRRSTLTRFVFIVTGGVAVATLCYPERVSHYNHRGMVFARHCVVLGIELLRDGPQKSLGEGELDNPSTSFSDDETNQIKRSKNKQYDHNPSNNRVFGTQNNHDPAIKKVFGTQNDHDPAIKRVDATQNGHDPSNRRGFGTQHDHDPAIKRVDGTQNDDDPSNRRVYGTQLDHNPSNERNFGTPGYNPELDTKINYANTRQDGPDDVAVTYHADGYPDPHIQCKVPSSNDDEVVSSKCNTEITGERTLPTDFVPYSPAHPSPPKRHSESYRPSQNNLKQNSMEDDECDSQKPIKSSFHYSKLEDPRTISEPQEAQYPEDEDSSNHRVLEDEPITPSSEELAQPNSNDNRYYGRQPKDTIASSDEGYDDLYTRRG